MKGINIAFVASSLLFTSVYANAGTPPMPSLTDAELASYDADFQEYYQWEQTFIHSLTYQDGFITLPGGIATINVPENFYYLSPEDADRVLVEGWGNIPGDNLTLGMLFPADYNPTQKQAWGVEISYEEDGHVKDKDAKKIDYDDLLKEMKSDVASESQWRVEQGYGTLELVGWASAPYYDEIGKKLYWAKELRFDDSDETTLNYNIRVLGREGVLVLNFIADMSQINQVEDNLDTVLAMPSFTTGNTYADFDSSVDKIAAYGIGGLVAGKVLAKTGLIATAFILLKKFGVILIVGVAAFFRKLFNKNPKN